MTDDVLHACQVLLADDEDGFREALARRLRHRGVPVAEVSSGQAVLDWFATGNDAHMVLLDIKLGDMDGRDVLRALMQREIPPAVIILSGHAYTDIALEAMQAGASDYLLKPCPMDDLLERMENAFDRLMERRNA
ncbi:MAG: response regulator [Desulfovibrionaceae bacterium]